VGRSASNGAATVRNSRQRYVLIAAFLVAFVQAVAMSACSIDDPIPSTRVEWVTLRAAQPGTPDIVAISSITRASAYAVGDSGLVLVLDDESWLEEPVPTSADLHAVWGVSASDVHIAGDGVALHWDGVEWTSFDLPNGFESGEEVRLWGRSRNEVYLLSPFGGMLVWDGASWSEFCADDPFFSCFEVVNDELEVSELSAIGGMRSGPIYLGDKQGNVYEWSTVSDKALQVVLTLEIHPECPSGMDIRQIWTTNTGVWVAPWSATCEVGSDTEWICRLMVYDRNVWRDEAPALGDYSCETIVDLAATDDELFAITALGRFLRHSAEVWEARDAPEGARSVAVVGSRVLVAGDGGVIAEFMGD